MIGGLTATVPPNCIQRTLNSWGANVALHHVAIPLSLILAITCGCGGNPANPQLSSGGGSASGSGGGSTGTSGGSGSGGTGAGTAFRATGSMAKARGIHTATLLANGTVLVAGGDGGGIPDIISGDAPLAADASAELYDPASALFTATGSMSSPRYGHTATLLPNGKVLVSGGFSDVGLSKGPPEATAELYNSVSRSFSAAGNMGTARAMHTATVLPNGTVLIAGGATQGGFEFPGFGVGITSVEVYDPTTNSFAPTGGMGTARYAHTATLLMNGKVLVTGGFSSFDVQSSGNALSTAELYDPATGAFTPTGSMATARGGQTATLLSNGKVLVTGGLINLSSAGVSVASSAELYDPATGTFAPAGGMRAAREQQTATLLPDGRVLIIGGSTASDPSFGIPPCTSCRAQASAEIYDPVTGSFSFADSMVTPRSEHTATLLSDGRVLVAGGDDAGGRRDTSSDPLASAEIFRLP